MRTTDLTSQKEKTTQHSRVSPPQNENGKMSVHLAQYEDVCDATHSQNNAGEILYLILNYLFTPTTT